MDMLDWIGLRTTGQNKGLEQEIHWNTEIFC
jgi:Zn-dependent M32 family carboxypeptidase